MENPASAPGALAVIPMLGAGGLRIVAASRVERLGGAVTTRRIPPTIATPDAATSVIATFSSVFAWD
jgi:hypothetical protein